MTHSIPARALVLPDTTLALDAGWLAVTAVDEDGGSWPWLLAPGDDHTISGCPCPQCVPHETTGPLPGALQDRLNRCGAPTRAGTTCRRRPAPTTRSGRCHIHAPARTT